LRRGGWRDPVKLGLFLVPIWMVIFVTLTGPIVSSQLRAVVRVAWPIRDEIGYNMAHWHMLSFIVAIAMFLLYVDGFKGFLARNLPSLLIIVGGTLALAGSFIYEPSPVFAGVKAGISIELATSISCSLKQASLPIIEAGLSVSFVSYTIFAIHLIYRFLRR
jgi:hypothetical protein